MLHVSWHIYGARTHVRTSAARVRTQQVRTHTQTYRQFTFTVTYTHTHTHTHTCAKAQSFADLGSHVVLHATLHNVTIVYFEQMQPISEYIYYVVKVQGRQINIIEQVYFLHEFSLFHLVHGYDK